MATESALALSASADAAAATVTAMTTIAGTVETDAGVVGRRERGMDVDCTCVRMHLCPHTSTLPELATVTPTAARTDTLARTCNVGARMRLMGPQFGTFGVTATMTIHLTMLLGTTMAPC